MTTFCVNLNIHYSAPQEIWDKLESVYAEMPQWKGFTNGYPQWYGEGGKLIEGSVESSGLQLYGKLPQDEWTAWLQLFKDKATAALGYPIGEPENGFEFQFMDQGDAIMDAQDYIDELRAKKRRNGIIGIVAVVILAIIILPGLFRDDGFSEEDLTKVLAQMPELALTDSEKALADTILAPGTFRNALTYDLTGSTTFTLEEVEDIIAPVLREDALVNEIAVRGAVVVIDFQALGTRTILEYVDADRSGTVDQIRKGISHLWLPDAQNFCRVQYTVATGETTLVECYDSFLTQS